MRIIFIGSVEFSYRALEKLVALDADVVDVFTSDNRNINSVFPFPRFREAIIAFAKIRGAASGYKNAEGFKLLEARED